MKKSFIGLLFLAALFSACEETETTTVDITGQGTIRGTVLADTDQSDGLSESEPVVGAIIRVSWDSEDLTVVSDGDSRTESRVAVTDANGVYAVSVPTIKEGVTYEVDFDEIEREITFNDGAASTTKKVAFNSSSENVIVKTGETVVVDYDYESDYKTNTVLDKFATIFGTVVVDSEQLNSKGIPEDADGATITIKWQNNNGIDNSLTTTSDASGAYSIQVPTEDVNGNFTAVFEDFTTAVDYNDGFRNVTGFSATFLEGSKSNIALNSGDREEVNFSYASNFKVALPIFAKIEGNIEVRTNNIPGQEDEDPVSGIILRFTWNDADNIQRGASATTNANGNYSIEVPITFDNTINLVVPEIIISNYEFNNGTNDVIGTATYNEFNTTIGLGKGQTQTFNYSDISPNKVVEN